MSALLILPVAPPHVYRLVSQDALGLTPAAMAQALLGHHISLLAPTAGSGSGTPLHRQVAPTAVPTSANGMATASLSSGRLAPPLAATPPPPPTALLPEGDLAGLISLASSESDSRRTALRAMLLYFDDRATEAAYLDFKSGVLAPGRSWFCVLFPCAVAVGQWRNCTPGSSLLRRLLTFALLAAPCAAGWWQLRVRRSTRHMEALCTASFCSRVVLKVLWAAHAALRPHPFARGRLSVLLECAFMLLFCCFEQVCGKGAVPLVLYICMLGGTAHSTYII